eukprot:m.53829 g.53829  ORF g.53829 m.53829 type:complete len:99 (+) comp34282_c0_seq12:289-585(+)
MMAVTKASFIVLDAEFVELEAESIFFIVIDVDFAFQILTKTLTNVLKRLQGAIAQSAWKYGGLVSYFGNASACIVGFAWITYCLPRSCLWSPFAYVMP